MATDTATKGKKKTTSKKDTPAAPPTPPAGVKETRKPLSETLILSQLFLEDGTFASRPVFRYNKVYGGAYAIRQAILRKISKASAEDIMALPRRSRNTMFALVKSEIGRYYGTAVRRQDNDDTGTKAGEPLPQLQFNNKVEAASYGATARAAKANLIKIIFPEGAAEKTPAAA